MQEVDESKVTSWMRRNPVLIIHKAPTPDDERARELCEEAFGKTLQIGQCVPDAKAENDNGYMNAPMPRLLTGTSVCLGCADIEGFIRHLSKMQDAGH